MAKKKHKTYRKKTVVKKSKVKRRIIRKKPVRKQKPRRQVKRQVKKQFTKTDLQVCKKCGSIMIPLKKGKTIYMQCRSCKYKTRKHARDIKLSESVERKRGIVVLEKDSAVLPITDKICSQCEHKAAYWWMQQTRASDEPPTQFFKCVKCSHVWREYK
ncbi:transcription factor S [Candidatus Aenigmatarchaeota archaeon]